MINMDWNALVTSVIGLISGGWLFSLYSAKPRKTSIELENVGKAMDEMNSVIAAMKESSLTYRQNTNSLIKELEEKIDNLEKTIEIKDEAIYSAYDCPLPAKASDCIVLKVFKRCKECEVDTHITQNHNQDENNE